MGKPNPVGGDLRKLLVQYWAAMASIGGLAAVFYAMAAVKQVWLFVVIAVGGLLVVVTIWCFLRVRDLVRSARDSLLLRERLQSAEGHIEALKRSNGELQKLAEQQYLNGIEEGRDLANSEFGGVLFAIPRLIALTLRDEKPLLIAELEDKPSGSGLRPRATTVGMRYSLASTTTHEIKGVVKVTEIDNTIGRAYLQCIQELVPAFWKRLTEAAAMEDLPTNLALIRFSRNRDGLVVVPAIVSEIVNPQVGPIR